MDPLLAPFINAKDPSEAERRLGELISGHADPIIAGVVRRKLYSREHQQEVEDLCSEARLHLIERLRQLRTDPAESPIASFGDYVAMVAFHTCDGYLRRVYPKRSQLKNRIRYAIERHQSLALWEEKGERLAGFAAWQGGRRSQAVDAKVQRLLNAPEEWPFSDPAEHDDPAALMAALFRHLGGPVGLDRLLQLVATIWRITNEMPVKAKADHETTPDPVERAPDRRPDISTLVSYRLYLQRLWQEIRDLPVRQRVALLLNLRDAQGASMIELIPLCGVAAIREIAALLEIEAARFAALWNTLPLDDLMISQHLGVTRQQVINLRKCARERLARRMKESPW